MSETDSTDSEDYDNEYDNNDVEYEPEEQSLTRFNIILCELHNVRIHGKACNNVKANYLVYCRFKNLNMYYINDIIHFMNIKYANLNNLQHNIFRNYKNIILNIKPEIAQCIYLDTQECIAILKTFWIKIIQRTWKNIIKKRKEIIKNRCNIFSLKYREINGKFPKELLNYPTLKGMLYKKL